MVPLVKFNPLLTELPPKYPLPKENPLLDHVLLPEPKDQILLQEILLKEALPLLLIDQLPLVCLIEPFEFNSIPLEVNLLDKIVHPPILPEPLAVKLLNTALPSLLIDHSPSVCFIEPSELISIFLLESLLLAIVHPPILP